MFLWHPCTSALRSGHSYRKWKSWSVLLRVSFLEKCELQNIQTLTLTQIQPHSQCPQFSLTYSVMMVILCSSACGARPWGHPNIFYGENDLILYSVDTSQFTLFIFPGPTRWACCCLQCFQTSCIKTALLHSTMLYMPLQICSHYVLNRVLKVEYDFKHLKN